MFESMAQQLGGLCNSNVMAGFRRGEMSEIYVGQPNHQQVATQSFDPFLAVLREIPDPRRAEGMLYKLPLRSAVLHSCRSHRQQFLPLYRDLHPSASPSAEHRLRSALEARARPHRHPLHPSPDGLLRVWPVDRRVGSPRNNGPELLKTICRIVPARPHTCGDPAPVGRAAA